MIFNSLKQIVFQVTNNLSFDENNPTKNFVNRILTGVILFKTLQKIVISKKEETDNIKDIAKQYSVTFKNIVSDLEGKFISYKQIYEKIESYNLPNFLSISERQITEIYTLYENKAEVKEFSLFDFSIKMYKLLNLKESYFKRLSKIHFNVICPIINYYAKMYNILMRDVNIEDVGSTPTHQIKLAINGISSNQIYNDLYRDVMNVKNSFYDFKISSNNSVLLTLR